MIHQITAFVLFPFDARNAKVKIRAVIQHTRRSGITAVINAGIISSLLRWMMKNDFLLLRSNDPIAKV